MVATLAERQDVVLVAGRRANDLAFRLVALSEIGVGAAVKRAIVECAATEAVEAARLQPVEDARIRAALSSRFIAFGISRWMMRALCKGMTTEGGSTAPFDAGSSNKQPKLQVGLSQALRPFSGKAEQDRGLGSSRWEASAPGLDPAEAESGEDEARLDDSAAEAEEDEDEDEDGDEAIAGKAVRSRSASITDSQSMQPGAVWKRCVLAARALFRDKAYADGAVQAASVAIKARHKRRLSQLTMIEYALGAQAAVPEEDAAKAATMAARAAVKAVNTVSRVVASALGLQMRGPVTKQHGGRGKGPSKAAGAAEDAKLTHAQRAARAAELLVLSEQLSQSARGLELKGRATVCSVVEGSRATTPLEVFTAVTASDAVLRARAGVIVAGVGQQRTAARLRRLAACIEEAGILAGPALPQRAVWRRGFEDASLLRLAAGADAAVADSMVQSRKGRILAELSRRRDRIAALQQGKVAGIGLRERVMLSARIASERLRSMGKEAGVALLLGPGDTGTDDDRHVNDHRGDAAEVVQPPKNSAAWGSDSDSDGEGTTTGVRRRRKVGVAIQGLAMSLEEQRRPGVLRVFRG